MAGAFIGAKMSHAAGTVQKYLGFTLFAQGGVAVGLSIMASQKFSPEVSKVVIMVVATTTLVVQILGPFAVKYGVKKAGEVGMNITEDDLILTYKVGDVVDREAPTISEGLPLREILNTFCNHDAIFYPTVNRNGQLVGTITISGIKETFNQDRKSVV